MSYAPLWESAARELEELRKRPAETLSQIDSVDGTVATWVAHWALTRPETTAVHFYGRDITYAELDNLADRAAEWLRSHGVSTGDRVALYMGNCPQYLILFVATMRLGAVLVPVNPMFRASDFTYEINDSSPKVVVAQEELRAVVEASHAGLDSVPHVAYTRLSDTLTATPQPRAPFEREEVSADWQEITNTAPLAQRPEVDPASLAALNYTGGTTGLPKGCEHTHEHMVYTALSTLAVRGIRPGDKPEVYLCFLPIFWIAGENAGILNPLIDGSTVVLLTRYHPDAVLELLEDQKVTFMVAPADVYYELLAKDVASRSLVLDQVLAVSFVRKLTVDLREQWMKATGSLLCEAAYGMTETHTMDTSTFGLQENNQDLQAEPIYTGYPVPGTQIIVVDHDLKPVKPGEIGQILVNSPSVLTRYFNRPEATQESLIEGWLLTGDTGRFDEHGGLTYLARTKEMIKVNGMSVFPAELESFLKQHPEVGSVAVAPRNDSKRGQVPVAFVVRAEGSLITADELTEWARTNIAEYKIPEITFVETMPMTATGKIRKVDLVAALNQED